MQSLLVGRLFGEQPCREVLKMIGERSLAMIFKPVDVPGRFTLGSTKRRPSLLTELETRYKNST
ncbi:MAG: hypothetical protein ACKV2Q_10070 [Planctomycetaceae bacterium]